jgi:anti-sigma B factor antagonist
MAALSCRVVPVKTVPGAAVVQLQGSIDPRNLTTLETTISSTSFHTLVLDLAEIRYINSAGLAYLVNLSDTLLDQGGRLLLANAQPKVKVVFDLMGVSEFFHLYRSVDTALRAIRPSLAAARRS